MSIKIMVQVWEMDLPTTEKFVLVSLADQANDAGVCWPSMSMIAKRCGLKERAVYYAMDRLIERGVVEKRARAGTSNSYVVQPHNMKADPCTTCTPALNAPLHDVQPSPAPNAGAPLHHVQTTPAPRADEPSMNRQLEPSMNHQRDPAADEVLKQAVSAWNEMARQTGLAEVQKLTDARKSKLRARLKDCGGLDGWAVALSKIRESPFLRGEKTAWKADFDFVLQEKSFTKLMEGGYDASLGSNKKWPDQSKLTPAERLVAAALGGC